MRALAVALFLVAPTAVGAQTPAAGQRFKLATPTLVLGPGQQSGTFTVSVLASGLPTDSKTALLLVDQKSPAAPPVQVETKLLQAGVASSANQLWQFAVDVRGFPPAVSQSRVFLVSYADLHETLPYTLTNIETRAFAWSVRSSPEWNLGSMKSLQIPIRVGDISATAVTLHQADLSSEDKLKRTLGKEHFTLCANAPPEACAPVPELLEPQRAHSVYLRPRGDIPPGVFKGNISLLAREKTEPDVLPVTIYSPRPNGFLLGFLALALGVLLSLAVQVLSRSWFQRKKEREIVALLRKRVEDLDGDFSQLPANLRTAAAGWSNRSERLKKDLDAIAPLLRPIVPQPFEVEVASIETFKTVIERQGNTFAHLRLLLREGLEKVRDIQRNHGDRTDDTEASAGRIGDIPPGESAMAGVTAELNDLRGKVREPMPMRAAAARRSADEELKSIGLQLIAASMVVWLFWGLVSILSGALLLIFQNPAFGTEMDLLICVLWGLGITVAGQQAPQVTPSGVAGSIGVKFPGGK